MTIQEPGARGQQPGGGKPPTPESWEAHEAWRTKATWEAEYQAGGWDYLRDLYELGRYSVIVGYVQHLGDSPRILDLGCGQGLLMERLRALTHRYVGCDYALPAIRTAINRAASASSFVVGDATYPPFKPASFDIVICNEVLYYVPDLDKTLTSVLRLLANGGHIIVSQFDAEALDASWRRIRARMQVEDMVSVTHLKAECTWRIALLRPGNAAVGPTEC